MPDLVVVMPPRIGGDPWKRARIRESGRPGAGRRGRVFPRKAGAFLYSKRIWTLGNPALRRASTVFPRRLEGTSGETLRMTADPPFLPASFKTGWIVSREWAFLVMGLTPGGTLGSIRTMERTEGPPPFPFRA